jgi:LacI family transcriptional regulator
LQTTHRKNPPSPTLLDIARETQTSVSTVSRVLSGGTTAQRISEPTRVRVLAAAKKLGYRPNLIARSLRTRRSNTIAMIVSDIANPWFGQVASLVEQSLHRHGYSLMICNSGEDAELENEYLQLLPQKGIDGLILVPILRSKKALMDHVPEDLPLVVFDRPISGIPGSVTSDQDQLAHLLCDTVKRVGVKKVAIVAGPQHVMTHRRRREIVAEEFDVLSVFEGPAQAETGRKGFIQFLSMQPDAIVCTNNFLGVGVLDLINQLEKPPVIACFDELPMMHLLPIPIATGQQDVPMLAEACVSQLLPQLTGGRAPSDHVLVPSRVVTNPAFQAMYEASHPRGG